MPSSGLYDMGISIPGFDMREHVFEDPVIEEYT
jgi:hypothetical protein